MTASEFPLRDNATEATRRARWLRAKPRDWTAPGMLAAGAWAMLAAIVLVREMTIVRVPAGSQTIPRLPYGLEAASIAPVIVLAAIALALTAFWWWARARERETVTPLPARSASTRLLLLVSVLAGAVTLLYWLLRPLPGSVPCGEVVHINTILGYVHNCDSPAFEYLAQHPRNLLNPGEIRQTRPVYPLTGWAILPLVGLAARVLPLGGDHGFYALEAVGVAALAVTVYCFLRYLLRLGAWPAAAAAVTFPLLFNHITVSLTSPHTTIFTLVVPVASVLLVRRFLTRAPRWWEAVVYGGALGVATLAYGLWIVAFATAALALLLHGFRTAIKPAIVFASAFAAPNLAWIVLCTVAAGRYYNYEAEVYRQFVWVLDAAGGGPKELWATASSYAFMTAREILAVRELWLAGVMIAALVVAGVIARAGLRPADREGYATLAGIGLTLVVTPLFLFGIGYYEPRFGYALLPPLLMLAGWLVTRIGTKSRLLATAVPTVCGLYVVYLATSWFGPA